MSKSSLIDKFVAGTYWPILVIAIGAIVAGPLAAWSNLINPRALIPSTIIIGGLDFLLFVSALLDGDTRTAVDELNSDRRRRWKSMTWKERIFGVPGDVKIKICLFVIWIEFVVFLLTARKEAQLFMFASFAACCLLLLLTLKRYLSPGAS